ncbi:hypothetical protein BJ508DRAFT_327602 [Ascobolus immersus RN42]|uniref:2OGFeDO JBP1/TET oxygenase domain-containing protein n=1 Tax=Ascobolus immersus RN42 TaxID=1160509 RepID=A0A3N4I294_ASCIM|nr:hypothetical protein BJ508DRAFT_327602 [Ascobolus immersus RN42]
MSPLLRPRKFRQSVDVSSSPFVTYKRVRSTAAHAPKLNSTATNIVLSPPTSTSGRAGDLELPATLLGNSTASPPWPATQHDRQTSRARSRARARGPVPSKSTASRKSQSATKSTSMRPTVPRSRSAVGQTLAPDEKIRFKLRIQLDAVLDKYEGARHGTWEPEVDTSVRNEREDDGQASRSTPGPEPPHNPRQEGFPSWLETCNKEQIIEFLDNRRAILAKSALDPSILLSHAKSLCDYGDSQPSVPLPAPPPPPIQKARDFGSSKRPSGPKQRRNKNRPGRMNHYGQKREERNARIASVLASPDFAEVRSHLQSLDISELVNHRGNRQPKAEESLALLEEGESYFRVPTHISDEGFCITDNEGKVIVDVLPVGTIPAKLLEQFETSFSSLCEDIPPSHFKISKTDKRFVKPARTGEHGGVLHLGVWNQSTWQHERPSVSQSMRGDKTNYRADSLHVRLNLFLSENWELFRHLGGILKAQDPLLYEKYESVELPHGIDKTLFWPFCMMALNRNYLSLPHKDLNDYIKGFCLLHCWGDFKGGDLTLRELRLRIPFSKGQVLLFRSALLTHWNQPIEDGGIRHSMVLFTPWRMLEWKSIAIKQVTNRLKREVDAAVERLKVLGGR